MAAAELVDVGAALQDRGYVTRDPDPRDPRRKRLRVTPLGFEVMRQGEAIFDELRAGWERQIGADELAAVEGRLAKLVGTGPIRFDTPGWIAHNLGGST